MLNSDELRDIADFNDACIALFNTMCAAKHVDISFDHDVTGSYIVLRKDGTLIGKVQFADSGSYEFVPEIEVEK